MGFIIVKYDGSPEGFIEPISAGAGAFNPLAANVTTLDSSMQESGTIDGFQFFEARPYDVHSFGDGGV